MEIKNGKALWVPEDLLGNWIKCTPEQAKILLTYFNLPPVANGEDALYNICKGKKAFTIAHLSDAKIKGYFGFDAIKFPENNKKVNISNCIGKWIKCTANEFMELASFFNIKTIYSYDGYYHIKGNHRVDFRFGYDEGDYINFKDIVFPKSQEQKKIIGYKCPVELFGGRIKIGTVFKYSHTDVYRGEESQYSVYMLPKEIVEAWEPVYEPTMKYAKNTALLTKDGRIVGNAIITDYLDDNYLITTDYGNKVRFSEKELESQWYIGKVKNVSNHKYAVKTK